MVANDLLELELDPPLEVAGILSGRETVDTSTGPEHGKAFAALGVFGSRSLKDGRVLEIISRHEERLEIEMIVTAAEPAGVCQLAQRWARERKCPLLVHFLQAQKYARGMWEHRSDHVINDSDIVLLIHDGVSRGTHNELLRTIKAGKPYIYERINAQCAAGF